MYVDKIHDFRTNIDNIFDQAQRNRSDMKTMQEAIADTAASIVQAKDDQESAINIKTMEDELEGMKDEFLKVERAYKVQVGAITDVLKEYKFL